MGRRNIGATLSLNNGNFFTNARSAVSASNQLKSATTNAVGSLRDMGGQSSKTGVSIMGMAKTVVGAVAAFQGIKKGVDFLKDCTEAAKKAEVANIKLDTVMKNIAGTTDAQVDSVKKAASELSSYTTIGGSTAKMGAAQLSVFGLQSNAINTLLPAVGDLAVGINGINVSQEQMEATSKMVGKAMTGSTAALKKAGIVIDEQGQKILKSGTESEKLKVITDAVAKSYGGVAKAMAATPEGRIMLMQKAWSKVKVEIGNAVLPIITQTLEMIYSKVPKVQGVILGAINAVKPALSYVITNIMPKVSAGFEWVGGVATRIFNSVNDAIIRVKDKFTGLNIDVGGTGGVLQSAFEMCQPAINWLIDTGIPLVVGLVGDVIIKATDMYNFIAANWSLISPIVTGIAEAVLIYKGVLMVTEYWTKLVTFATGLWTGAVNLWNATTAGTFGVQAAWAAWRAKDIIETGILYALYAKDAVVKGIHTVATWGQVAATGALTAGQWLLNAAFIASPIGWVVLGIGLIVGAFVLLWKKCEPFRNFFIGMWEGFKVTISSFSGFFKGVINGIISGVNWLIGSFVGGINNLINGVNSISGAVGIPAIPNIPVPQIPGLWQGGDILRGGRVLVGERGAEILDLPTGARVTPLDKAQKTENIINMNIYVTGQTSDEVVNEIVPKLKLALANL